MGGLSNRIDNNENIDKKNTNFLFFKDIINDSYAFSALDNTISVFKSIDDILLLIYSNKNKSIIIYNLINLQKINEIKNAHDEYIINFRHYSYIFKKIDLILSISSTDNNIKVWNIQNLNCLLNIKNINKIGNLYSACFLNDNNQIYIISCNSNFNQNNFELIKVYDYRGNIIKEIKNSDDDTYFIDDYYDNKLSTNYILTGNLGYVKAYDYKNNKLYYKYSDNDNKIHSSIVINGVDKNIDLIESSDDGNIRIWDFHLGILLNKIKISFGQLYGICLWDKNFLFVGGNETIRVINIRYKKTIKILKGHKNWVLTLKKIHLPFFGECIISQGFDEKIKLWINKSC